MLLSIVAKYYTTTEWSHLHPRSYRFDSQKITVKSAQRHSHECKTPDVDFDTLSMIVKRLHNTINEFKTIKKLVKTNIENNNKILQQFEKSMLLMEFNQHYLSKFLEDGKLSQKDSMEFLIVEEMRNKENVIEKEMTEHINEPRS